MAKYYAIVILLFILCVPSSLGKPIESDGEPQQDFIFPSGGGSNCNNVYFMQQTGNGRKDIDQRGAQGCQAIDNNVPTSIYLMGNGNSRCNYQVYGFYGSSCDGDTQPVRLPLYSQQPAILNGNNGHGRQPTCSFQLYTPGGRATSVIFSNGYDGDQKFEVNHSGCYPIRDNFNCNYYPSRVTVLSDGNTNDVRLFSGLRCSGDSHTPGRDGTIGQAGKIRSYRIVSTS